MGLIGLKLHLEENKREDFLFHNLIIKANNTAWSIRKDIQRCCGYEYDVHV